MVIPLSVQIPLSKCPLCGLPTDSSVCPRCNTIIAWDKAACPKCGRMYSMAFAICDVCDEKLKPMEDARDAEASIKSMMLVGGLSREAAQTLYKQGISDFSELVKLALPPGAARLGLHKTIARRMMMAEYIKQGKKFEEGICPVCQSPFDEETGYCQKCRYSPLPEGSDDWIKGRLDKVADEVESLMTNPDFQEMPDESKKQALDEINEELEPVEDEEKMISELESVFGPVETEDESKLQYRLQIQAWREKGFNVDELEKLLETDIEKFRNEGVRLVRSQIRKQNDELEFECGMCHTRVGGDAEECPKCGARFS